jgi:hypothetical protein
MEDDYKDLKIDIENMRAQNNLVRETLPLSALKTQTIMPGEDYGGLVVCDTRDMNDKTEGNLQIVLYVAGEKHEFTFNRGLLNSKQ